MGKAKWPRAQRDAIAQRSAEVRRQHSVASAREPLERLQGAVVAIGDAFGTDADCASAAALLRESARLMGYDLQPRPVSAFVHDKGTGNIAVMGRRALDRLSPEAAARLEEQKTADFDSGHLVLTSDDPSVLYDANLRQVASVGIEAPSIMLNIKSTSPESGEWVANFGDLTVLYILDEDNRILIDAMERIAPSLQENARALVENLRDGVSVEKLRQMSSEARASGD